MKLSRRHALQFAAATALTPLPGIARAESYPSRPITVIVPFAAGGPLDIAGRILTASMQETLGQPVIIENVSGAGGTIGLARVARADPDGYTIGLSIWTTQVINGALYNLSYDLQKDFEPIALYTDGPLVLVARKTIPANNLQEFIGWLKANPDKVTAGTVGIGSRSMFSAFCLRKRPARTFSSPSIAAAVRSCRIWSAARSTCFLRRGHRTAANPRRHHQSLRGDGQDPFGRAAGHSDRR